MSSVIGALRVNLGLDSAQFSKGASAAQKSMQNMRKQFLVVAAAAAALGAALTAAAMNGAKEIDATAKAARRLDSSTTGFQALQLAAGEAGVSMSSLTNDVQTLNRELAANSVGAQRAMKALGLAASDLAGLDADQKLALLADRIKDTGMNAGQASVILRDLGIRNREMALAVIQGGDAFRNARADIESYGLELSGGTAAAMEQANDRIGRLSIVSTIFGRNLASQLVPALGRFAQTITDSVREGGRLRGALDALNIVSGIMARAVDAVNNNLEFLIDLFKVLVAAKLALFLGSVVSGMLMLARAVRTAGLVSVAFTSIMRAKITALALVAAVVAKATGQFENMASWLDATGKAIMNALPDSLRDNVNSLGDSIMGLGQSIDDLAVSSGTAMTNNAAAADLVSDSFGTATRSAGGATKAIKEADKTADNLATTLSGPLTSAVDGVANAFADFMMRGFRDFKSFARGILDSFKSMLAQMIATAARNKIMLSMGMGGSTAGSMASAAGSAMGGGGGMMGGIGSAVAGAGGLAGLGSAFLGGGSFVASGLMSGGLAGAGSAMATAMSGATLGIGGLAAAAGAVLLPLAAVVAAVTFFRTTTKTLDTGLRVTVKNTDALVESFKKVEKSKFWGLSKSTSTKFKEVVDSPIAAAIGDMQTSILDAARVLGVGGSAFDDFSYKFKVSLKGLSQDQQMAKINEELGKMGDSFATLAPGVENMNSLLQQAAQISASIRALTDTQGLFATRQDAVFAASQAGNQRTIGKTPSELLVEILRAIREGDINQARLSSQLVTLQQRAELAPT